MSIVISAKHIVIPAKSAVISTRAGQTRPALINYDASFICLSDTLCAVSSIFSAKIP